MKAKRQTVFLIIILLLGQGCSGFPIGFKVYHDSKETDKTVNSEPPVYETTASNPSTHCSEKTNPPCFRPLIPKTGLVTYHTFDQCVEVAPYEIPLGKMTCEKGISQTGLVVGGKKITEVPEIGQFQFKKSFSICFWIQLKEDFCSPSTQGLNDKTMLFSKGETCPDGNKKKYQGHSFALFMGGKYKQNNYFEGCNSLTFFLSTETGNHFSPRVFASHLTSLQTNKFYHFCSVFSYSKKQFTFYLNGRKESASHVYEKGSTASHQIISPSELGEMSQNQSPLRIGGAKSYCGGIEHYETFEPKAVLDEMYFYEKALSTKDVVQLYKNGKYSNLPLVFSSQEVSAL